ncbi:MAG: MucB/RseB C-terminal domain-containing protein [Gammaproteobacteria bacterium]
MPSKPSHSKRFFSGIYRSGAGVLAALVLATQSAHADSVGEWLERLSSAYGSLNYAGTFVYRHQGGVETMSVVQSSRDGHVQQRLQSLNGVPREILRDGDSVACILPDSGKVVVGEGANKVSITERYTNLDVQALAEHYTMTLGDTIRVAGRNCRILRIEPMDALRYGYRLCLDEERAMLLKSLVIDERGHVVEEMLFTDVEFPERIDDRELVASVRMDSFEVEAHTRDANVQEQSGGHWMVSNLPSGFIPRAVSTAGGVEHQVLSDGLATISVFVEALPGDDDDGLGAAELGAIKTYTARIGSDHLATVVGEVPSATVRMVAENIRPASH